jgi:SAM-dependent methyltransferase
MTGLHEMIPEARAARLARQNWSQAADIWEDFVEGGKDFSRDLVHGPALLRAIGDVRSLRVLDLGCGQGYFTRKLAARGAHVIGIDWSAGMIARATARETRQPQGIEYRVIDARRTGEAFAAGSFDLLVACMSFMDAPGLDRILRGANRVLKPDGRLVFSIVHPVNGSRVSQWEKARVGAHGHRIFDYYFDEGANAMHWGQKRLRRPFFVPHWHYTLGTWFTKLERAGFQVSNMVEPRPTESQTRAHISLEGARRVPFWLVVSTVKLRQVRPRPGRPAAPKTRTGPPSS